MACEFLDSAETGPAGRDAFAPLLEVRALRVAYPESEDAVSGFTTTLGRGEAVGLVGESGSGKSTITLAVMGLLPRQARISGSILFDGLELLWHPEALRRIRWRRASILLQDAMNALNPVMTIGEQIAELYVFHEGASWGEASRRAEEVLEEVDLPRSTAQVFPHELSGGQKQRAALAMAIALSPELVIVDEPTSALDVVSADMVARQLQSLQQRLGCSLLVISHDISLVARVCDRAAVMQRGRVVEEGPIGNLITRPAHPYTRALVEAVPRLPGGEEHG